MSVLQLSALLTLLNFVVATPFPAHNKSEACTFNLPTSYAALGDSFAAGLGSGFAIDDDGKLLKTPLMQTILKRSSSMPTPEWLLPVSALRIEPFQWRSGELRLSGLLW